MSSDDAEYGNVRKYSELAENSVSSRDQSNIDRKLTNLQQTVDDLERALLLLFDRIEPSQGPEMPVSDSDRADSAEYQEQSKIARVVENMDDQLRRLYWRVQRETERVEM